MSLHPQAHGLGLVVSFHGGGWVLHGFVSLADLLDDGQAALAEAGDAISAALA